jgi:SPP1 family predicted phage head-tail adaptor
MQAGKLNTRLTLQHATLTRDEMGGEIETWVDVVIVWASKAHQTSREFFAAQKINAETTDLFVIRYREGITTKMRAVCYGKTYDIIGAPDPDGRRRELHLLCKEII